MTTQEEEEKEEEQVPPPTSRDVPPPDCANKCWKCHSTNVTTRISHTKANPNRPFDVCRNCNQFLGWVFKLLAEQNDVNSPPVTRSPFYNSLVAGPLAAENMLLTPSKLNNRRTALDVSEQHLVADSAERDRQCDLTVQDRAERLLGVTTGTTRRRVRSTYDLPQQRVKPGDSDTPHERSGETPGSSPEPTSLRLMSRSPSSTKQLFTVVLTSMMRLSGASYVSPVSSIPDVTPLAPVSQHVEYDLLSLLLSVWVIIECSWFLSRPRSERSHWTYSTYHHTTDSRGYVSSRLR